MLWDLATFFLGGLLFLFLIWKGLREDYSSNLIFSTGFLIIGVILLSQVITKFVLREWWFWAAIFASIFASFFSIRRYHFKFFEATDALTAAFFPWLAILFLFDSLKRKSYFSLGAFFVILAAYLLYLFISMNYKKFAWYRSGKVGLAALLAVSILFLLRGLSSVFLGDMISFVGSYDTIISGAISFMCFLGIVHLVRQGN